MKRDEKIPCGRKGLSIKTGCLRLSEPGTGMGKSGWVMGHSLGGAAAAKEYLEVPGGRVRPNFGDSGELRS